MKVKLKPCDGDCEGGLRHIWKQEGKKRYCKSCWFKIISNEKIIPFFKKQKTISKESEKRKKEHVIYSIMRLQFLKNNPYCGMNIQGICLGKANEIQHLKGRGKYYLDTRYWLSGCSPCHRYATDHPQEAINNGWALLKLTNN